MFVCHTVSELRFYGCCHSCYFRIIELYGFFPTCLYSEWITIFSTMPFMLRGVHRNVVETMKLGVGWQVASAKQFS